MSPDEARAYAASVTGLDASKTTIRYPKGGPLIVENLFPARPVSIMDLAMFSAKGELPAKRVVPVDKDYHLFPRCSALRLVSPEELYAQLAPRAHYKWDLPTAARIKRQYWEGEAGLRELSRDFKVSVKDVYRLVHSLTYWYAWEA